MGRIMMMIMLGIVVFGGIWYNQAGLSTGNSASTDLPTEPATPSPSEVPTEPATPSPSEMPTEPATPSPSEMPSIVSLLANSVPSVTAEVNRDGLAVVTNAKSLYVLVNKKRNLPANYEPEDLVVPDVPFSFSGDSPKKQMREEAAGALESLFKAAKKDRIGLKAVSGYRSYATQKSIFEGNAKRKGEEIANRTSARPGQSEHQTGLAMDISSASVSYGLEESFGETKEGKWLAKHAADHGFIIRYMKGKETITGYSYEPWHVRYVGKEIAKDIMKKKVTLEEYFDEIEAALKV